MPLAKSLSRIRRVLALVAAVAIAPSAFAQGGQAGIDVRVGYGADATRVVVDSPVPVSSLREDSGSGEVDLMLRGPDAGVALEGEGHGLVRYWRLDAGEGGSRLTLTLNAKGRLVRTFLIPPGEQTTMYRYVIDLARADEAPPPSVIAPQAPKRPVEMVARDTIPAALADAPVRPAPQGVVRSTPSVGVVSFDHAPRRKAKLIRAPDTDGAPEVQAAALAATPLKTHETPTARVEQPVRLTQESRNIDAAPAERERPVHLALSERRVIVIDAGHGGHDPGAQSDGVNEKDITLAAAWRLRHRLLRDGRYRVVMTRASDVFVPLEDRVRIARRSGADLFIALHADSAGDNGDTHGASVYTLSGHGETRVKEVLSGREWFNRATPHNDPSVKGILLDLTQRSTINRSNEFAQLLVDRLSERIDVLPKSHRDASYFVLLAPDVPAVLLEMGFITSPEDQARLTDPVRRNALMDTVGDAIDEYFRGEVKVAER